MRWILGTTALLLAADLASAGDLICTDRRYTLRAVSHKVEVAVDNQIGITRVEQVFANPHDVQLEGQYTFPVPKGATIIDFSMTINGKLMRGELLERDRARSIYEGIVRQSKDPGLLEHVGANIFRVRVFPILPRSEQKIELTYVERVAYDAGACRYVYPLLVPGGAGTTKAELFQFRLRLSSLVPIKDVACPTHRADIVRRGEESAEVKVEARDVDLSKDLEVGYRLVRAASGMDLVAHRPDAEDGTFLLLLTPEADPAPLPKDMTFVFDTSGSMEGRRIRQAKAALKFCLAKLRPDDRFNILTFASDVQGYRPGHVQATFAEKESADKFVDAIEATGSTNIDGALQAALKHRAGEGRPHLILFLTDGRPTAGETRPEAIVRRTLDVGAGTRIFTFGVGDDLDRRLLEELAEGTRAVAEHVSELESIEEKVSRLQKKIGTPVLSELSIDWGGAEVAAVFPRALGDLYAGSQLMVTGRYKKAGAFTLTLKGKAGSRAVELKREVAFPERVDVAPGVPYLWAMRRVATLTDEIQRRGENPELVQEIVAVSKKHRIASPYTSFLVLETEQAYDQHGVDRKSARWQPPSPTAQAPARKPLDMAKSADDRSETVDEEEFQKAKDDSQDSVSDRPFRGRGSYDTIGGAGGGGGRYGTRLGGKKDLVARGGGSVLTEDSVLKALKWLAKQQKPDGSWEGSAGGTGLPLLAFLGAGYSHLSKDTHEGICFGDVVRKALQFLMTRQGASGEFSAASRDHALAALALSEAYGLTGSKLLKDPAQKGIDFLIRIQTPGAGWGDAGGWAVLALKSAELSGLAFPRSGYDGARAAFEKETTAVATLSRILMDRNRVDPRHVEAVDLLLKSRPATSRDALGWFWGTRTLHQFDGPAGPKWREWNESLKDVLLKSQAADGAWEAVETTALHALTLEVYYAYPNVFGAR